MGFLFIGLVAVSIALGIIGLIGIAFFLAFTLRFLDYYTNAPDFLNVDNVFGWIVIIIGFMIAASIIGFVVYVVLATIHFPGKIMIAGSYPDGFPLYIAGCVWMGTVTVAAWTGVGYVTYLFMNYASANPELSEFFANGSWFAYVCAFLVASSVLLPSAKSI